MYANSDNAVMTENDTALTFSDSFRIMLDDARKWAERSGFIEEDVDSIIKSVRKRKRS